MKVTNHFAQDIHFWGEGGYLDIFQWTISVNIKAGAKKSVFGGVVMAELFLAKDD